MKLGTVPSLLRQLLEFSSGGFTIFQHFGWTCAPLVLGLLLVLASWSIITGASAADLLLEQ
jgi:hypothetical protein